MCARGAGFAGRNTGTRKNIPLANYYHCCMKKETRIAIIYMPSGKEIKYTTKDLGAGGTDYHLVERIEGEHGQLNVVTKDKDGAFTAEAYVGIPYLLQILTP